MKEADSTQQTDHPRPKFLAPAGILSRGRSAAVFLYFDLIHFRGAGQLTGAALLLLPMSPESWDVCLVRTYSTSA
jgi:hypothetical protein